MRLLRRRSTVGIRVGTAGNEADCCILVRLLINYFISKIGGYDIVFHEEHVQNQLIPYHFQLVDTGDGTGS